MYIDSRYPIRHTLPPGGSGERARDYIKQGLGLSTLPQGERQRTIYSLYHARSGLDSCTVSASPLCAQSRRSEPSWIMAQFWKIFIRFRGPRFPRMTVLKSPVSDVITTSASPRTE